MRWRRRPVLAFVVRAVVVLAPLLASVTVGVVASRQFRPHDRPTLVLWVLWTGAASLLALWAVDVVARRLLPLHRLVQLCLAFPDRAPSRPRIAARAPRSPPPAAVLVRFRTPPTAASVAGAVGTQPAARGVAGASRHPTDGRSRGRAGGHTAGRPRHPRPADPRPLRAGLCLQRPTGGADAAVGHGPRPHQLGRARARHRQA